VTNFCAPSIFAKQGLRKDSMKLLEVRKHHGHSAKFLSQAKWQTAFGAAKREDSLFIKAEVSQLFLANRIFHSKT